MSMATRIQQRMDALNLTQEALARRARISQTAIHKILSGKTRETRKIAQLAAALNCSTEYLLHGTDAIRECDPAYTSSAIGTAVDGTSGISSPMSDQQSDPDERSERASGPLSLSQEELALLDDFRLLDPIDRDDLVVQLRARAERARRYLNRPRA